MATSRLENDKALGKGFSNVLFIEFLSSMCVCVYIYIYMYLCMYVCIYVCTYACTYVRTYVRMCVCMYVCMYVCMCVCVCMYVCMYVCLYMFVHMYESLAAFHLHMQKLQHTVPVTGRRLPSAVHRAAEALLPCGLHFRRNFPQCRTRIIAFLCREHPSSF